MLNFFFILELFGIFSQQNKWGGGEYIAVQFASGKILSPRTYIINAALNPKIQKYTNYVRYIQRARSTNFMHEERSL